MAYPAPRHVQFLRGNTAAVSTYLGFAGELVVDTTNWTLYVHDGVTVGGYAATVNTASITGNISSILNGTAVFGNIIPSANTVYSLGNITHQWNDLFVSNNTIYVGGVPLGIDATGNLTVNGNVIPTIGYVNTVVANVTVDLSSYALNANVTAANVGLKGYVDQANTIQSAQLTSANLGIIGYIDQANTIQSAQISAANVGMQGYVDQANIIQSAQVNAANLAITAANVGMKGYVDAAVANIAPSSSYGNANVASYLPTYSGNIAANISKAGYTWTFGTDGNLTVPNNSVINPDSGYITIGSGDGSGLLVGASGSLFNADNTNFVIYGNRSDPGTSITIPSNDSAGNGQPLIIDNQISNVEIVSGFNTWEFSTDGNLTLPHNSRIAEVPSPVYGNYALSLSGTGAVSPDQQLLIYPTSVDANHLHLTTGNLYNTELFFGNDDLYVKLSNVGDVVVNTNNNQGNTAQWTFGSDGSLSLPDTGTIVFPDTTIQSTAFSNSAIDTYFLDGTAKTIAGNLTIEGNLFVNGNVSYISVNNIVIGDNIINLADLNPADSLDLGFVAHRTPSLQPLQHTGLVRDASTDQWRLFSNVVPAPGTTVDFTNAIYDDLVLGNITSPTIDSLVNVISAANIGIIGYIDQANTIQSQQITAANVGIIGYIDQANTIQSQQITAANVGMKGYVDSQTFYSNARVATYLQYGNISNISVAGNVTAGYFIGNGALLTGIAASSSYSNVQVATYLPTYTGNLSAGNANVISNLTVGGYLTTSGSGGNISGANYITANIILTNGGWGNISQVANIQANAVLVSGNVTATYFLGNGALLTGITASGSSYSNVQVATYLPTYTGVVTASNVAVNGNVTAQYLFGNGSQLTGLPSSYSNVNVATYLPTYSGNIANIRLGVSGVLTFPDGTTQITAATGGGSSYSNVNVAAYLNTQGYNLYSNVNVAAYLATGLSSNIVVGTGAYFVGNVSATTTMQYGAGQGGLLFTKLVGGTGAAIYSLNVVPSAQNYALSTNGAALNLNAPTGGGIYSSINNSIVTTVTAGYLNVAGNISAANVSASYVNVTGNISAANVSAQYLFGDGSNLTNMYSNVNVANYLPSHTGNVGVNYILGTTPNVTLTAGTFNSVFDTTGNVILPTAYVAGNVTAGYFIGNGALLTGIAASSNYSNVQVEVFANLSNYAYNANVTSANLGMKGYIDNSVSTANIGMKGYVDSVASQSIYGNVNVAAYLNATGYNLYSNVNVAAYISTYTGNVSALNFVGNTRAQVGFSFAYAQDAFGAISDTGSVFLPADANSNAIVTGYTIVGNSGAVTLTVTSASFVAGSPNFVQVNTSPSPVVFTYPVTVYTANYSPAQSSTITVGNATVSGNVTAQYFFGNGAFLTGIVASGSSYSNVQVATYLPTYTGVVTASNVAVAGNVTAQYLFGNGSQLTGIASSYSNVQVAAYLNTNNYSPYSNVNVAVYLTTATITTSGNITAGNITATSNLTVTNYITTSGTGGNISGVNFYLGNLAILTGNITASSFIGSGALLTSLPGYAYGNVNVASYLGATQITVANIRLSASGNIVFPDGTIQTTAASGSYSNVQVATYLPTYTGVITASNVAVNGNVTAQFLFGNGSQLTGLPSSYSNVQVATYLPTYTGNIANIRLGVSGVLTFPDGTTQITAGGGSYSNVQVATYLPTYTGVITASNVAVNGNVTAQFLFGNGSQLTGIAGNYSNVQVATYLPLYGGAIQSSNVQTTSANIQTTTAATNTATGALRVMGGVGVAGAVVAAQLNSTGNLIANAISAYSLNTVANVVASVVNAGTINSSGNVLAQNLTGTLTTASQTAITAVGTLATLSVSGNATVGNLVGNEANTRIIANVYTTTFDIYGNVTFPGNVITPTGLYVGPTLFTALPNTIAQFTANANAYAQINFENISSGTDATADYIATANNGTDTTFFVDLGIANSNYDNASPNNSLGTAVFANDSYLYAQGNLATTVGGNLVIGTSTADKTVKIFAGGINSSNIVMTVASTGANIGGFGVTMPTRPAFRVNGSTQNIPQTLTANVNLKGNAIVTIFNQGSYFDATTGKFTAPVAGIYSVGLNARVGTNNALNQIAVLKNGLNSAGNVVCFWESDTNTGTAVHFGVNGTIILATGDYLSANILAGNITFDQNDNWHVTYIG